MNGKQFGALIATAVAMAMMEGSAVAADGSADKAEAKACYRKSCGSSVKGHSGSCAGTKVDGITDEKACTDAGGSWTTASGADSMKDMH
ncbi:MAG: hypothetical protein ABI629_25595 [bacterium]